MRGSDWRVAGSTQDAEGPGSATRCGSGPWGQRHRGQRYGRLAAPAWADPPSGHPRGKLMAMSKLPGLRPGCNQARLFLFRFDRIARYVLPAQASPALPAGWRSSAASY
jgi:hypothetical protein